MRHPFSLIHVVSLEYSDAKKERLTAVVVALAILLPTMSRPYRECALASEYTSTVTGTDHRPLLEPANLCDQTIGNEFPESDTSLEITGLKCCILMQN